MKTPGRPPGNRLGVEAEQSVKLTSTNQSESYSFAIIVQYIVAEQVAHAVYDVIAMQFSESEALGP